MNRRAFFKKVMGAAALAGMTLAVRPEVRAWASFLPGQASARLKFSGRQLQGTSNGRLLESLDGGLTWQKIADFGSHCSIQAIQERQGLLYLRIGLLQYHFFLQSADGRRWLTAADFAAA